MSELYLLGIDNGGTVAKAAIVARTAASWRSPRARPNRCTPAPGWVEFDAEALWQATAAAVRRVIDKAGISPDKIAAVACTGHGNGLYLVDADGRPVRNAIFSADARARKYVERWTAAGVDRAVRPKTMQALWPGQPNALLAWLADHEPSVVSRTRWCLMCKDYTRMRLTGEAYAEQTDMSGTSLLDVGDGQYDAGLLEAFGIGAWGEKLPPLRLSSDLCGRVTRAAAEATGLLPGTPVAGGLFDIDACALSSALLDENQLGDDVRHLGHQSVCVAHAGRRQGVHDFALLRAGLLPDARGKRHLGGQPRVVPCAVLSQRSRRGTRSGWRSVCRDQAWVAQTAAEETGLFFLPFLYGSSVGADATGCLVGLSARHDRRHIARAVYEGVVFGHRLHLERLLAVRAMPETIRQRRGGAERRLDADGGRRVSVPGRSARRDGIGRLGPAMCGAVAVGLHSDYPAACAAMTRCSRRFVPQADLAKTYAAKFQRFARLLAHSNPLGANWPGGPDGECLNSPSEHGQQVDRATREEHRQRLEPHLMVDHGRPGGADGSGGCGRGRADPPRKVRISAPLR